MMDQHHILLLERLNRELEASDPGLLVAFPYQAYLDLLCRRATFTGYRDPGAELAAFCSRIAARGGAELLCRYQRGLLCHIAGLGLSAPLPAQFPDAVKLQCRDEFKRMIAELAEHPPEWYSWEEDLFCKDLAICCFRMFPAGFLKVEMHAGIPRSLLLRVGLGEKFPLMALVARLGGFRPYFEMHLDVRQKETFNPQGWQYSLCLVGRTMEAFPEVKGLTGSSWFFDPRIRAISPRLVYLREMIELAGSSFFFFGRSERTTELATSASPTRRARYLEGRYLPASYLAVWPRRELIRYAAQEGTA